LAFIVYSEHQQNREWEEFLMLDVLTSFAVGMAMGVVLGAAVLLAGAAVKRLRRGGRRC
jgi:hypothetical protein